MGDGKIPVELKITYGTTDRGDIGGHKGVFDPEENSLKAQGNTRAQARSRLRQALSRPFGPSLNTPFSLKLDPM